MSPHPNLTLSLPSFKHKLTHTSRFLPPPNLTRTSGGPRPHPNITSFVPNLIPTSGGHSPSLGAWPGAGTAAGLVWGGGVVGGRHLLRHHVLRAAAILDHSATLNTDVYHMYVNKYGGFLDTCLYYMTESDAIYK